MKIKNWVLIININEMCIERTRFNSKVIILYPNIFKTYNETMYKKK